MRQLARLALALWCVVAAVGAAERFVTTPDGVRLFVLEEGRGTPVIVLHGGPGFSSQGYVPDLEPLARTFRLVYYDQRGSGLSTVVSDAEKLTADLFVEDLDRVRVSLGAPRIALLGHSWGGGLAGLYAMAHPQHVSRLLLVDPMPPRRSYLEQFQTALRSRFDADDQRLLAEISERRRTAADDRVQDECRAYYRVFIKGYLSDPSRAQRLKGDFCGAPPPAIRNFGRVNGSVLGSLGDFDLRARLAAVRVPALVVHGDRDPIPLESAREWAASLPDARLLVVGDSGHFPYVEQPDAFFPAATEFLRGRWPARSTRGS